MKIQTESKLPELGSTQFTLSDTIHMIERQWQLDSFFRIEGPSNSKDVRIINLKNMTSGLSKIEKVSNFAMLLFTSGIFCVAGATTLILFKSFFAVILTAGAAGSFIGNKVLHKTAETAKKLKDIMIELTHTLEDGDFENKGNTNYSQRNNWSAKLGIIKNELNDLGYLRRKVIKLTKKCLFDAKCSIFSRNKCFNKLAIPTPLVESRY